MRQHFKRVVSAVLATALVAQVGVVSAWAAPLKAQNVPAAAGMHPFTGTPDLIRSPPSLTLGCASDRSPPFLLYYVVE